MGHYDDGNHGSNAPGDVEMAHLPAGYLRYDSGWSLTRPCLYLKKEKLQTGRP